MIGGTYDILAEEGSTLELQFEYLDESSVAVNITSASYIVDFLLKKTSTKVDTFLFGMDSRGNQVEGTILYPNTHGTFGSLTKTGSSNGSFKLIINSDTMAELTPGTYFYHLRLINGSTVTPLCKGRFTVESKVK
jgi:hypothetical protein